MISLVIAIAVVLLLSAFFTGVEAASLSITHPEVDLLKQQERFGSNWLAKIHANVDHAIIAMVIMSNITSIVGSVVIGQIAANVYGSAALAIVTVVLTLSMIVFSEIIPKTLGIHYNKSVALYCASTIYFLILILYPIVLLLEWLTNHLKHGEKHIGTEEQIRSLVTMGRKAGHIETDEGHLIHRAFILNDKTAQDSMTPLKDIVFVRHSMTVAQALDEVRDTGYSRIPVFRDSINEIEGFVLLVDLLEEVAFSDSNVPLEPFIREPLVVEAHMKADELLILFRDQHVHLAVVQKDDHTIGIISLEDVLEELVGDIEDEIDAEEWL